MNVAMYTDFFKTLKSDGVLKAADLAKAAGFDSVEMLEIRALELIPDEKSARQTREILSDRGLEMSCYSFAVDMIPFDKYGNIVGDTAEAEKVTIEAARIASKLGSPYFHHTLVTNLRPDLHLPKPPYNEVLETLVGAASRIARACNDMGITVLYEPQGFYVNGSKNFGEFYNEMKRLGYNVGVCGDMANTLFVDERPVEFYKNFASEIRHVHVKDYAITDQPPKNCDCWESSKGKWLREIDIGTGVVNAKACFKELKKVDYKGAISLEFQHSDEGFARTMSYVSDIMSNVGL
jgi:sugar phosphate isomerase/epimerase